MFFAGAADRATVYFGLPYQTLVWVARFAVVVAPLVVFFATRRVCRELQEADRVAHEQELAEQAGERDERAVALRAGLPVTPYPEEDRMRSAHASAERS